MTTIEQTSEGSGPASPEVNPLAVAERRQCGTLCRWTTICCRSSESSTGPGHRSMTTGGSAVAPTTEERRRPPSGDARSQSSRTRWRRSTREATCSSWRAERDGGPTNSLAPLITSRSSTPHRRPCRSTDSAVARTDVGYVVADIFDWHPERSYDVVFFSFWLSHVPRPLISGFWDLVRSCLAPGGRVFLIDNRTDPIPAPKMQDPFVVEYKPDLQLRRLSDGSEYRVVKVMYEPEELQQVLDTEGWDTDIDATRW